MWFVCMSTAVLPQEVPSCPQIFVQAMAGKQALALYFSAHWCPPCRGFTPQLAEWYKQELKNGNGGRESPFIWRPTMDSDLSNWGYGFIYSYFFKKKCWTSLYYDRSI